MRKMLRDWFREERAKLSEMDFKQAVRYIRHYYWMWILAILGGIAGIIYLLVLLLRGAPEYHLYAVFADTQARAGNNSRIWRDFTEFSGWDLSQKQVEFNAAVYFDYIKDQGRGNTYYNSFITWADTGTLDLITMDPQQIAALGQSGRLLDWNLERCAALREKYADRLIWYEPPEDAPEQTGRDRCQRQPAGDKIRTVAGGLRAGDRCWKHPAGRGRRVSGLYFFGGGVNDA